MNHTGHRTHPSRLSRRRRETFRQIKCDLSRRLRFRTDRRRRSPIRPRLRPTYPATLLSRRSRAQFCPYLLSSSPSPSPSSSFCEPLAVPWIAASSFGHHLDTEASVARSLAHSGTGSLRAVGVARVKARPTMGGSGCPSPHTAQNLDFLFIA